MHILNVAFLRRRRHLCRIRVVPYRWTIPNLAKSWFDAHYNDLAHTFTRTLFSSCGHLSYCFFFFSAWLEWARLLLSLTTLAELLLSQTTLVEPAGRLDKILLGPSWSKIYRSSQCRLKIRNILRWEWSWQPHLYYSVSLKFLQNFQNLKNLWNTSRARKCVVMTDNILF